MNPYYANWSYGYTLHPSTEASRGAYQVQYGGPGQPTNWSQIKDQSPPVPPPKAKVFITASPASVKTEPVTVSSPGPGTAETVKIEQPPPPPAPLAAGPTTTVRLNYLNTPVLFMTILTGGSRPHGIAEAS